MGNLSKRQRFELGFALMMSVLVVAAAVATGRFDFVSGNRAMTLYDERYTPAQVRFNTEARLEGGWAVTSDGLKLEPGQSGSVTIRVKNEPESQLVALISGRRGSGFRWSVSVSGDGNAFRPVMRNVPLDRTRLDLTASVAYLASVWIKLSAESDGRSSGLEPAELSHVRVVARQAPLTVPNLPIAALLVLTPVLAYAVRASIRPAGALPFSLLVLGGIAVLAEAIARMRMVDVLLPWWERAVLSQQYNHYLVVPYGLLLVLWWWRARQEKGFESQRKSWLSFALLGILAWGGSTRLSALVEWGWSRTNPDVIWYMQLSQAMTSPYDTGWREPAWIWIIKAWFWSTGNTTLMHQRVLTIALSTALLWVAYKLFRDYTDLPLVGLLAAGLLCVNPYLIGLSTQGMREETYLIAVLCFVYFIFVADTKYSLRGQVIGLALSGAAVQLLRFNSYVIVIPLLAVWAWKQAAGKRRYVALPLAFITLLSVPHMVHNGRAYGDPMYSVNVHYAWARNHEFVNFKKVGCEGCPSREELQVACCGGPPVGLYGYLFGMHSLEEIVERVGRGYLDMYLRPTVWFGIQSGTQSYLGYMFYLVGLGAILFSPYRAMVGVIVLLANGVPFAMTLGIDPRIGIQTVPFVTFILAYGICWSFAQVVRCRALLSAPSSALCETGALPRSGVQ
jgi:hypothetical protein